MLVVSRRCGRARKEKEGRNGEIARNKKVRFFDCLKNDHLKKVEAEHVNDAKRFEVKHGRV